MRPFLSFLEGFKSESEVRLWLKSFPGPLENLRALAVCDCTISAKGAFQSWDDPKVKKLFWLFQSAAPSVLPSAKVVSVRLLNEAADRVQSKMTKKLKGQLVGLK